MSQIIINTNLKTNKQNMTAGELFGLYYEYYHNRLDQIEELEDNVFFDLLDEVDTADIVDAEDFRKQLKLQAQGK